MYSLCWTHVLRHPYLHMNKNNTFTKDNKTEELIQLQEIVQSTDLFPYLFIASYIILKYLLLPNFFLFIDSILGNYNFLLFLALMFGFHFKIHMPHSYCYMRSTASQSAIF